MDKYWLEESQSIDHIIDWLDVLVDEYQGVFQTIGRFCDESDQFCDEPQFDPNGGWGVSFAPLASRWVRPNGETTPWLDYGDDKWNFSRPTEVGDYSIRELPRDEAAMIISDLPHPPPDDPYWSEHIIGERIFRIGETITVPNWVSPDWSDSEGKPKPQGK